MTFAGVPIALAACISIGTFGFANGGYFPVSWGWGALALLLLAALVLAAGVPAELAVLDVVFLGALAGLAGWIALSLLWSTSVPLTVQEVERVLVYLAAGVAGVLLVRRRSVASLMVGVWFGLAVITTYALLTRLFPDQLGTFEPIANYRLSEPVGYWNGLGILAAMGGLLALGLAARSGPLIRCLAAGSSVIFMLVLYFTYSRGSWIAFLFGLTLAVALDRHRLQLVTTALVLTPWSAIAVGAASSSSALTHQAAQLDSATRDGHGLAVIAIGLVVCASLTVLAVDWIGSSFSVPSGVRRVYVGILLFLLAAFLIAVFGRYGFPPALARKAYDAFNASKVEGSDLNRRLFNLSGNGRNEQWHTAWQETRVHPVLGGGAGTYSEFWMQQRRTPGTVHDVHNLYLEALAELGPFGLMLVAIVFGTPLAAIRRARAAPLVPIVFGAYCAYLLHAAADWDWELPAITLTALFCGIGVLAAGRSDREPVALPGGVRLTGLLATAAVFGFALLGLLGNSAVSASSKSTDAGHFARAESQARSAMSYVPWSPEPWRKLGEAQQLAGNVAAARATFLEAIEKDPRDWTLWYELALASHGAAKQRAFAQASRLNPLDERLRPEAGG
jgi:O-antigen ligase/polysaccharide polymerase Wzy-like membrane protein/tetratricopeptide repeat protein